ncbi:MAG: MBL fold metallo-hydrolase [Hyphomicrobiaceae bacterium]
MLTRRRTLKIGGAAAAAMAAGAAVFGARRANAYYQGPPSDHFDGTRFFNPNGVGPRGPGAFLKWQFGSRGERWPASFPSPFNDKPPARVAGGRLRITFVGHATFLIQTAGRNILVDPVWSERASPVSFAGPRRVNVPGIAFDDLSHIDAVLITHNHYDHMDTGTIARLWQRDRPVVVAALGNDAILKDAIPGLAVTAGDWGDSVALDGGVTVHVVPTQHWSARGTTDRMHALWASFVVRTADRGVYCVGDSGFGDGSIFRAVGRDHPGLDVALLPIGAYEPRWFMRNQHMNPEDSVAAFRLCGARKALGHHWGTFRLTNEAIDQPPADLAAALAARDMDAAAFTALRPGMVHELG